MARGVPEPREPESSRTWGKGGGRQRACARLPGGAGALLASLPGRDPVLRVGAGGESRAVLAALEKGEKEMRTDPDAWEGLVCFWDGRGRVDGSCVSAAAPYGVKEFFVGR